MSQYNGIIAASLEPLAVTASTALNATTPITNLFDDRPRRIVEAAGLTMTFDIDLGVATAFDLIAILYTNAEADGTWSAVGANSQAGLDAGDELVAAGTSIWASGEGATMTRRHGFARLDPVTYRWLRISLIGGTIDIGVLQVGRVVVSQSLQPEWNFEIGSSVGRQPLVDEKRSRTGQVTRRLWQRRRVLSLDFPDLTEDEVYGSLETIAEAADERPVLLIQEPDPTATYRMKKMFYGELVIQTAKVDGAEYRARLQLTEWT